MEGLTILFFNLLAFNQLMKKVVNSSLKKISVYVKKKRSHIYCDKFRYLGSQYLVLIGKSFTGSFAGKIVVLKFF